MEGIPGRSRDHGSQNRQTAQNFGLRHNTRSEARQELRPPPPAGMGGIPGRSRDHGSQNRQTAQSFGLPQHP
ncbi:hypothetical protein K227x_16830 [Rubripirellula lacrimiformis]|uniref:Uncharacterized protein n=1 Tax=Rubripirellula lacrimiformis TaxID=1930273 RepID=A0A517N843_9BACT|nr:hypothetical protein K227x_16830 [Rubripirellula lacrimiformis]